MNLRLEKEITQVYIKLKVPLDLIIKMQTITNSVCLKGYKYEVDIK